jgi:hypothetical protein
MIRRFQGILLAGGVVASFASWMPAATAESKPPAVSARASQRKPASDSAAQRQRELNDMWREDVAAQLALLGVPLKWQDHTLAELVDWRDRIEAAVTLRVQYRVDVDWRATSLRELTEMRLRAAKASELSSLYGVHVDWRRYSWVSLEGLRRRMSTLSRDPIGASAFAADGLARPGSTGKPRRPGRYPRDPDAIIAPTFAFDTPLIWSRPFGQRAQPDPDAILIPTFVTVPSPPAGRDDVIDPWAPRSP